MKTSAFLSVFAILLSFLCGRGSNLDTSFDKTYLYFQVDEIPSFQHDNKDLLEYVYSRIEWPKGLEAQGTVVVSFTVMGSGEISDVHVVKSLAQQCDEQIVRILMDMPKWTPGLKGDQFVSVIMFLPINFKIYVD